MASFASRKSIDGVLFPEGFSRAASVVSENYPLIKVDEYKDRAFIPATGDLLELPLNSIIVKSGMGDLVADQIVYPWDLEDNGQGARVRDQDNIDNAKRHRL